MDAKALLADVRGTGMTQAEVAIALGITQGNVSKLERGQIKDFKSAVFVKLLELHQQKVGVANGRGNIVPAPAAPCVPSTKQPCIAVV
jgi:predicted XRE-type DNA-binding protein